MLKKDQEKVRTGRKKKNVIPFYKPWYVSNGRVNGSPYDPAALGLITRLESQLIPDLNA